LVATVAREGETDDAVWKLAAGGFRDTSRLAASDVQMIGDILSTNTQAVATILAMFRMHLAHLEAMLISRDDQHLADMLRPTREARLKGAEQYGNGGARSEERRVGKERGWRRLAFPYKTGCPRGVVEGRRERGRICWK